MIALLSGILYYVMKEETFSHSSPFYQKMLKDRFRSNEQRWQLFKKFNVIKGKLGSFWLGDHALCCASYIDLDEGVRLELIFTLRVNAISHA